MFGRDLVGAPDPDTSFLGRVMTSFPLDAWDDLADLIDAALELPERERAAWLVEACPDARRRAVVEELLALATRADAFLAEPACERVPQLARDAVGGAGEVPKELPGRVGPYRIVREVGRGGMGEVYLAERDDDEFHREVAVKLVRGGGPDLLERFRHERQILASLDHENIARLYDGGVTEDGRPYFVMEYVRGEPIDRYADAHALDVEARLWLFAAVARAVAHAHRKLVVHRDIKPANILVDGDGTPKLLDFGLAKLLEPDDARSDGAPVTRLGFRVLTPEYASPEQFAGEPVSTASDVYSLGVLLHELLVGSGPYGPERSSPRVVERTALQGVEARPSGHLGPLRSRSELEAVAEARSTTVERLRRRVRGDLDTIVSTALRREPDRRYASVDALVDDVLRHLQRRPIRARPQTWRYRAGRFVRRHRAGVALGVAVVLSVVGGVGATLWQANAATREAVRAERIRDFLVSVFETSDPDRARGETLTARELLDQGFRRAGQELAAEPEALADMMSVFGTLYLRLGLLDEADTAFARGLALRRETGADRAAVADALTDVAGVRAARGEWERAEALQREALAVLGGDLRPGDPAHTGALLDLAASLNAQARYEESAPLYEEVVASRRAAGDSAGVAEALNGYGLLRLRTGDPDSARALLERSVSLRRAALGEEHTLVAVTLCNLASAAESAGDYAAAAFSFQACLDVRRRRLDPDHPDIARTLNNMGMLASRRGDLVAADTLHRRALDVQRRAFGNVHPEVAGSLNNLAVVAYQRGDLSGAAETFRDVLEQWQTLLGEDHPNTITTLNNLGMTLMADGQLGAAAPVLGEALATRIRVLGPEHLDVAGSHANLSTLLLRQGRGAEAEREARTAIDIYDALVPEGHPSSVGALLNLVRLREPQGRCAEVLDEARRAVEIRVARLGDDNPSTADARLWLGRCLVDAGLASEAVPVLRAARDALASARGEDHETTREAEAALQEARGG